ncbi:serine/threonine-protein kinase [Cucumis melo var. makuwa]|uniref:Serine/threonine-protein kinase n=1 Tax=Cucumis melo var. makuwa TaxID=1194695 RepID=A0A5A7SNM2_CUCMM|nr:serine/threonine-protein kinase [Cucumis melo var. makuwa]
MALQMASRVKRAPDATSDSSGMVLRDDYSAVIYAMFLEFTEELDNLAGESSLVGGNSDTCYHLRLQLNDQAMNRFIEHKMVNTFKEFQGGCHRHFKKYSDPEETCANPSYLSPELDEQRGESVDRVKLFRQTHIQDGAFVSQAVEDAHGTQSLSGDKICKTVLGRRSGYSKDLGWGPKPKAHKTTNTSSSTISCPQSTVQL